MTVSEVIKKLQTRPYEERMRVFWVISILSALAVIAAWVALGSFAPKGPSGANELVQSWQEGAKSAGRGFTEMQRQISEQKIRASLPEGHAVKMIDFDANAGTGLLTIDLEINNPTSDILNLAGADRTNVYLQDGATRLMPQKFVTSSGQAVPGKILSNTKISAQAVFDRPQEKTVILNLADLYFESQPNAKFTESFELALDGKVQGLQNILLPRE
jgi:hypothetical protein